MYRPSGIVGRIPELLDQLKSECDCLSQEAVMYKSQREEFERKLQAQLSELSSIQKTLFELENKQSKMQQRYEEEIFRYQNSVGRHEMPPPSFANPSIAAQGPPDARIGDKQIQQPLVNPHHALRQPPPSFGQHPHPGSGPSPPIGSPLSAPSSSSSAPQGQIPSGPASSFSPIGAKRARPEEASHFNSHAPIPSIDSAPPAKQMAAMANDKHDFPSPSSVLPPASLAPNPLNVSGGGGGGSGVGVGGPGGIVGNGAREIEEKVGRGHGQPLYAAASTSGSSSSSSAPSSMPQSSSGAGGSSAGSSSAPPNETEDWRVGYNSNVQTNLGVDLAFDFEHQSVVCCVKFSNDGKWLATGCNKTAQIYSVSTGERVHVFTDDSKSGDSYLRSVCFSPDGKYLACGAEDKTIKLWDIERNTTAATLQGHTMDIYSLDFSNDGRFIVSGSGDKKARIWSVDKKTCLHVLGNDEVGPKDGVTSVAISPDGRYVAAGSLDRIVRLWDANTGYFLERYEGHTDSVYSVAFSPDGKSLASGSLDKTLRLWDLNGNRARSRCRTTFAGHSDFVLSVTFSPDGNWLISGSKDRSVQFWDPRSAVTHMKLEGHKNSVISVAVNPLGGYFATGSGDCKARVWKYKPCTPGSL